MTKNRTIEELGRRAKERHEKYRHLNDTQAGFAFKKDYPGHYEEFQGHEMPEGLKTRPTSTPQSNRKSHSLENSVVELLGDLREYEVDPKLEENLQVLLDYYNPKRGTFTSWWQRRKSEGRTALNLQVSAEYLSVIEQGHLLETAIREGKQKEIDFRMWVAKNGLILTELKVSNILIVEAAKVGLTVENDQHIKLEDELANIRIREEREKAINALNIKKEEAQEAVRLGIINKHLPEHQRLFLIHELLDICYTQIGKIEADETLSAATKTRMIEDRNSTIETFKKDMNARQAQLLQRYNREETGG